MFPLLGVYSISTSRDWTRAFWIGYKFWISWRSLSFFGNWFLISFVFFLYSFWKPEQEQDGQNTMEKENALCTIIKLHIRQFLLLFKNS